MKTLIVVAFFCVILYNLGAGLYYMVADGAEGTRMVKALTRRIALSLALFALVLVGIATGVVQPTGTGG